MEKLESKVDIARRYIDKYLEIYQRTQKQFSKRFVGTVIYNENPDIFKDAEDGRKFVREALGLTGTKSANNKQNLELKDKFAFINEQITDTPNNEPFVMPIAYYKTLIISDIHSIFYDKEAVFTALEYGKKKGCNSVLINGDFLDYYGYSKFSKDSRITAKFILEEREWGQEMLSLLQSEFGYVVYKEGNHDTRRKLQLVNFLASHPDIIEMATLQDYLFYDGINVQFVENYRIVKIGKLNALHGNEIYMTGGVNAARNMLLKTFDNVISGHSHISQSYPIKDLDGNLYMSYKTGCLCQLNPMYSPINQWNLGFAIVETEQDGTFHVDNKLMHKGKVY